MYKNKQYSIDSQLAESSDVDLQIQRANCQVILTFLSWEGNHKLFKSQLYIELKWKLFRVFFNNKDILPERNEQEDGQMDDIAKIQWYK